MPRLQNTHHISAAQMHDNPQNSVPAHSTSSDRKRSTPFVPPMYEGPARCRSTSTSEASGFSATAARATSEDGGGDTVSVENSTWRGAAGQGKARKGKARVGEHNGKFTLRNGKLKKKKSTSIFFVFIIVLYVNT